MEQNTDKTPLPKIIEILKKHSDYITDDHQAIGDFKFEDLANDLQAYCQSKQAAGEVNKIDWVERYSTLREESNMPDAINKMIKEYASQFTPQTGAATKLEWVRASERLPEVAGVSMPIRFNYHGTTIYATGKRNFDKESPKMYFEYGSQSFLTNDCEYLSETPTAEPLKEKSISPIHDLELLKKLWYQRNPCHENNADDGKDMFWGTVACVLDDYTAALQSKGSDT